MNDKIKFSRVLYSVFFLFLILVINTPAYAVDVVVPNSETDTEAASNNAFPWMANTSCDNGFRYQQVYDDSEIQDGFMVSVMRYRQNGLLDGNPHDNSFPDTIYSNVTITLSTTTADSSGLSGTFADNVGVDALIVFSGELTLSSAFSEALPRPFDIEIPFTTPFEYTGGNLLVDIVIEVCPNITKFFDYVQTAAPMARAFAADFTSLVGGTIPGQGLVTQFQLDPLVEEETYSVGGMVTGLTGTGLELENVGADTLPVAAAATAFTFATELEVGFSYVVTVSTQPTGQTCTVSNGSGTITDADITDVAVTCTDNPEPLYTINGTASGLGPNSVILQNNATDDLVVSANGAFVFATALPDGSTYDVTVLIQPTGQTCDVTNGFGTISGSDVLDVTVDCADAVVPPPAPTVPVPTLSEWALILLTMLIGLMVFANRRRLF